MCAEARSFGYFTKCCISASVYIDSYVKIKIYVMRNKKKASPFFLRRSFVVPAIFVLLIAGGFWAWQSQNAGKTSPSADSNKPRPVGSVDYGPAGPHDNDDIEARKDNPEKSPDTLDGFGNSSNTSGSLAVTVTRADVDTSGKTLQVGALAEGATSGTCLLKVTKGSEVITKTSPFGADVNSYSCTIFTVPLSDFPSSGEWQVSVTVQAEGKQGTGSWPTKVMISK